MHFLAVQVQKWKYNLPSRKRITPLIASLQSESLAFAQRMVLAAARQKGLTNLKVMAEFCTLTNVQVWALSRGSVCVVSVFD